MPSVSKWVQRLVFVPGMACVCVFALVFAFAMPSTGFSSTNNVNCSFDICWCCITIGSDITVGNRFTNFSNNKLALLLCINVWQCIQLNIKINCVYYQIKCNTQFLMQKWKSSPLPSFRGRPWNLNIELHTVYTLFSIAFSRFTSSASCSNEFIRPFGASSFIHIFDWVCEAYKRWLWNLQNVAANQSKLTWNVIETNYFYRYCSTGISRAWIFWRISTRSHHVLFCSLEQYGPLLNKHANNNK